MNEINWKTQEVIINPQLLDMIPKLNSWLPPDYIDEILRDVQVYLDYKNDWFSMGEFESIADRDMAKPSFVEFILKNTKTTVFDLTLFCSAWKRNPERVSNDGIENWGKRVGKIFGFEPVFSDTHNGLAEIDDTKIKNAVYGFNNPESRLYTIFTRGSIMRFIPKGFFILPIQQYPFMNFWETPFPEKKKKTKSKKSARRWEDIGWDDIDSLFK